MPKIKTNRAAAKRLKLTASGKIKRAKGFRNHILTKKSTKRKKNLAKATYVDPSNMRQMLQLLGRK